jgi:hypothetical protein
MLGEHICYTVYGSDYGCDQKFKQKRQVLAHCELLVWTTDELPASAEAVTIVHVGTRRSGLLQLWTELGSLSAKERTEFFLDFPSSESTSRCGVILSSDQAETLMRRTLFWVKQSPL